MMISRKPSPRCWGAPDGADMCGDGAPRDLRWQQGQDVLCLSIWVNYNDLTATSLESWLIREIIPKWPYFRLVN